MKKKVNRKKQANNVIFKIKKKQKKNYAMKITYK